MTVRVRLACLDSEADAAHVVALWRVSALRGDESVEADEASATQLMSALRQHPSVFILLAQMVESSDEASPTVVGMALCFLGFASDLARPTVQLHDLVVLESWRRRGVARQLLHAVEEAAVACGAGRVVLDVRPDHQAARALYRSEGFKSVRVSGKPILHLEKTVFCG